MISTKTAFAFLLIIAQIFGKSTAISCEWSNANISDTLLNISFLQQLSLNLAFAPKDIKPYKPIITNVVRTDRGRIMLAKFLRLFPDIVFESTQMEESVVFGSYILKSSSANPISIEIGNSIINTKVVLPKNLASTSSGKATDLSLANSKIITDLLFKIPQGHQSSLFVKSSNIISTDTHSIRKQLAKVVTLRLGYLYPKQKSANIVETLLPDSPKPLVQKADLLIKVALRKLANKDSECPASERRKSILNPQDLIQKLISSLNRTAYDADTSPNLENFIKDFATNLASSLDLDKIIIEILDVLDDDSIQLMSSFAAGAFSQFVLQATATNMGIFVGKTISAMIRSDKLLEIIEKMPDLRFLLSFVKPGNGVVFDWTNFEKFFNSQKFTELKNRILDRISDYMPTIAPKEIPEVPDVQVIENPYFIPNRLSFYNPGRSNANQMTWIYLLFGLSLLFFGDINHL